MTDPVVKAVIKQGIGRMGRVMTPGWQRILDGMPRRSHAGYKGARDYAACLQQGASALAGRGGGKSVATLGRLHAPSAAHPNQSSVFVSISSERSRDILTPAVWKFNELYDLKIEERRGDGAFIWPNGYRVLYRGCKDINECNKRRGTPWVRAHWDECASLNDTLFKYDIHECVEPRLVDFNGLWSVSGTPGPLPKGYWYDLTNGDNHTYPLFKWDARHNHHMPNVMKYFSDTLQRMSGVPDRKLWPRGCKSILDLINDPRCWKLLPNTFVREYLGQWVLDLRALIYKLGPKNTYSEFPIVPDRWTIGVDLGAHSEERPDLDHAAVCVCASHSTLPFVWVVMVEKLSDVTVDTLGARILQLIEEFPEAEAHIDAASAGKLIENTFKRMGIPIMAAEKAHKLRRIQRAQGAIRAGNLQLHATRCMDARIEAVSLVWNDDRDDHSPRCDDDAWDCILYGAIPHLDGFEPAKDEGPAKGTPEWEKLQELQEFEKALQDAMDENPDASWDFSPSEIWVPGNDLWLPVAA